MSDLKRLCETAGFRNVRTYIASGNVVAERDGSGSQAKAALEAELEAYAGKPAGEPTSVIVRTGDEMAEVVAANPFPGRAANLTIAVFLDRAPPPDACAKPRQRPGERGGPLGRPRDLCPLSRRDRALEAPHPGRSRGNRAQHEHRRQARRDGRRMRSATSRADIGKHEGAHGGTRPRSRKRKVRAVIDCRKSETKVRCLMEPSCPSATQGSPALPSARSETRGQASGKF